MLDELPETRAAILRLLKTRGFSSIPEIAATLGVSHEAARKQVLDLQQGGWIDSDCPPSEREREAVPGRPALRYCLTAAGDHFFPKQYPELFVMFLDRTDAPADVLARVTDAVVERLDGRVENPDVLRNIYRDDDPYTGVERRGEDVVLVERNCPYLEVAMERPSICSTTVSALHRLTGCEVVRERRFQDGDGRCEFHVRTATKSNARRKPRFEPEPPRSTR